MKKKFKTRAKEILSNPIELKDSMEYLTQLAMEQGYKMAKEGLTEAEMGEKLDVLDSDIKYLVNEFDLKRF